MPRLSTYEECLCFPYIRTRCTYYQVRQFICKYNLFFFIVSSSGNNLLCLLHPTSVMTISNRVTQEKFQILARCTKCGLFLARQKLCFLASKQVSSTTVSDTWGTALTALTSHTCHWQLNGQYELLCCRKLTSSLQQE